MHRKHLLLLFIVPFIAIPLAILIYTWGGHKPKALTPPSRNKDWVAVSRKDLERYVDSVMVWSPGTAARVSRDVKALGEPDILGFLYVAAVEKQIRDYVEKGRK